MARFLAGQVVKFTYRQHTGAGPDEITDDHKEVLVLHPNWNRKMHGIDLKRLTPAERAVLDAIFDPKIRDEVRKGGKPFKIPLVNDILRRMDPLEEVKNPMTFYSKFVKVFLRNKDAYRTYYPHLMLNPVIVEQTKVAGELINPKPLFHKVETKTQAKPEPTKPGISSREELIAKRQAMAKARQQGAAQPAAPAKPAQQAKPAQAPQKPLTGKDRLEYIKQQAMAKRPKKPQ